MKVSSVTLSSSKIRSLSSFVFALALLWGSGSCVTVNVNFPEGAVQKATDDYVRELYRSKKESEKSQESDDSASFRQLPAQDQFSQIFRSIIGVPTAFADVSAAFTVKTAKSLQIRKRLASRLSDVIKYKKKGYFGESNDGKIVIRSRSVKKLLKRKLSKIVEAENQDRKALYREVQQANNLSDSKLKGIESSFARSFQAESPSGTWVQGPTGKWTQKK